MNYDRLNEAIKLLTDTADILQEMMAATPPALASNLTVEAAKESVEKALAQMSAAINPPILSDIPTEILAKAEELGIPLDDIEIRVAISQHDVSQVAAILEEIDNKAESIKYRRKYFLIRLPDMPIEKLGSRLPVVTAQDFEFPSEAISKESLAEIKAKYNLDRLKEKKKGDRSSLFEKIKQAEKALGKSRENDDDEEIPF